MSQNKPQFFTSYFRRVMGNPKAVSIALSAPKGFKGGSCPALFPTWEMVNGFKSKILSEVDYTKLYWDLLKSRKVTPASIAEEFPDGTIFTCWEGPSLFCHRHLVSAWMRSGGINIKEMG